jgi:hypothetical protein
MKFKYPLEKGGIMKRMTLLILLLLALGTMLHAQDAQMSISCSPSEIFVNNLSTSTFDPVNPMSQPILTNISIRNDSEIAFIFQVNLQIYWNSIPLLNGSGITFQSLEQIQPGMVRNLTNRDFIRQEAGSILDKPDGDISLETIINSDTVLRNAIQSGFFPDGTITFVFTASSRDSNKAVPSLAETSFTIRIKNITNIFLTFPGRPIGENPPNVSTRPVTFLWNTMYTGHNNFSLVISEFPANRPPNIDNVSTTGRMVYEGVIIDRNLFSDYLPFQDGCYYAWQVSTGLFDENNPVTVSGKQQSSQAGILKSDWFVFRYSTDLAGEDSYYQQLLAYLNMLNNPVIQNVFAQGYRITGAVFSEGNASTGIDAVNLVKPLVGKQIDVVFSE